MSAERTLQVIRETSSVLRPEIQLGQLTDLGNAELFASLHADHLRYVKQRRQWLVYERGRWREDETGAAERAAKDTVREILRLAAAIEDDGGRRGVTRWALQSQSARAIEAMLRLAQTEPEIALSVDRLDADPFLLACANGTLDLRTGELRPHDSADMISLGTEIPYDPDATCPRWERFLREVFDGDEELVAFLRHAIGYSLTGDTREHALFILHGAGCNGKSTLMETVKLVLGGFALTASFDTFVRKRNDRNATNDLARLHRARLVMASESGQGRRLDEAVVKEVTGGDTIAPRFLYAEHFEFRPQFKLWLRTNHRPRVDGGDDAIWRRVRLIPFEVSFEGREDKELAETLAAELPGILRWAVEGCLEWQAEGLALPAKVRAATEEYRRDEDVLGAFLAECCELEPTAAVSKSDLRAAYDEFCAEQGEKPLTASVLGRELVRRGITSSGDGRRTYRGLRLRDGRASVAPSPVGAEEVERLFEGGL